MDDILYYKADKAFIKDVLKEIKEQFLILIELLGILFMGIFKGRGRKWDGWGPMPKPKLPRGWVNANKNHIMRKDIDAIMHPRNGKIKYVNNIWANKKASDIPGIFPICPKRNHAKIPRKRRINNA